MRHVLVISLLVWIIIAKGPIVYDITSMILHSRFVLKRNSHEDVSKLLWGHLPLIIDPMDKA